MQEPVVAINVSDVELASARRAKQKVLEILGGIENPTNPKVQGVGLTTSSSGKAAVHVLIRNDLPVADPVLPRTVLGVEVIIEKTAPITSLKEARARSNKEKTHSTLKRIANQLATKFGKKLNSGWPCSFKLSERYTVVIESIVPPGQDNYRVVVKALGALGTVPPLVADITIDQTTKSEVVSEFIKNVGDGLETLQSIQ